uniref:Uncharacterized protein n=1 Tax=Arundo donax TaxID=35708 RepID=A0A0A8ZBP5_ARUDO
MKSISNFDKRRCSSHNTCHHNGNRLW